MNLAHRNANVLCTGCTRRHRSYTQKLHFFAPPLDPELLSQWKRAIPRVDRARQKKRARYYVAFIFSEDLAKMYRLIINGKANKIDQTRWALKEKVVTVNFSNLPSYLSKKQT